MADAAADEEAAEAGGKRGLLEDPEVTSVAEPPSFSLSTNTNPSRSDSSGRMDQGSGTRKRRGKRKERDEEKSGRRGGRGIKKGRRVRGSEKGKWGVNVDGREEGKREDK